MENIVMGCDDVECLIGLLSRRHDLLTLLEETSRSKHELESALSISRSTVDRAVRNFEEESIVDRSSGGVSLTQYGRIVLDGYLQFRAGLVGLKTAKPVFSTLESDETVPFNMFREAQVVTSDRRSPHRPTVAFQQFLVDASDVKSVITGVVPEYVRTCHQQVVESGSTVEVVVESSVLEKMLTRYWDRIVDMLSTGRLMLYEVKTVPTYSVQVANADVREAAILTYGKGGVTGFVRSTVPAAVAWAEMEFERYRTDATLVAPME